MSLAEQELLILLEFTLVFSWIHVAQSLYICTVFSRSVFACFCLVILFSVVRLLILLAIILHPTCLTLLLNKGLRHIFHFLLLGKRYHFAGKRGIKINSINYFVDYYYGLICLIFFKIVMASVVMLLRS